MTLSAKFDEVSSFKCAFGEKNTFVSNDSNRITHKSRKATYQRRTVKLFKFVKTTPVDKTRNNFTYVIAFAVIFWDYSKEFIWVVAWWFGCSNLPRDIFPPIEIGDNATADCKSMFIIHCIVISDS